MASPQEEDGGRETMAAASREYQSAKQYAEHGWLVGFMPHNTKHGGPGTPGMNDFSSDPRALLRWRARMGNRCNIALMPPEGCMILDVDLHKLHGLEYELAEARVRKFYTDTGCGAAISAHGGVHLLVRDDPDANNATVRAMFDAPGEVRRRSGPGRGYVIGPGSVFDGKPYKEIEGHGFLQAANAPALPPGVLKPTAVVTPAVGNAAHQDFDPIPMGKPALERRVVLPLPELRNALSRVPADDYHLWLRVGMALHYDYAEEGFEFWDWWSQKSAKYDGEASLRAKWSSFGKNPNVNPVTSDTIAYIAREHGYGRASAQQDFGRGWMQKFKVAPALNSDPPAHDWVLQDFLLKGKVGMLAGAGGSGKSLFMYRLASMYALGLPHVLGRLELRLFDPAAHPGKVLILSAEDDADDVHRRMYATAEQLGVLKDDDQRERLGTRVAVMPCGGLDCRLVDKLGKPSDFADRVVEECLADSEVGLVMFDPSIFFSGVDDNRAEQVADYMRVLGGIAKRSGTGVLAITHTNKGAMNAEAVDQGNVRGSTAFVDLARSAMVMRGMTAVEAPLWNVVEAERWRYVGITIVKNNYAPQSAEPVWMQRGNGGVLAAPSPPLTKASPQQVQVARETARVEQRITRDEAVRMGKTERSMMKLLAHVGSSRVCTPALRAAEVQMSERSVKSLLSQMLEAKWIKIKYHATANMPHTYELTTGGKARLTQYEDKK